jgi:biopolymer transport protein ExbD
MAKQQVQETIAPNLIPMIDIMFLLLLFFMLSADMGQRELENVVLPPAKSVKEDKEKPNSRQLDRLTLNVFHSYKVTCEPYKKGAVCREDLHWKVGIKGRDYSDPEKLRAILKKEADRERTDTKHPDISERKVMVRSDASSPYGLTQRAMNVCAKAGIYKIEVGAASPPAAKGAKKNQG